MRAGAVVIALVARAAADGTGVIVLASDRAPVARAFAAAIGARGGVRVVDDALASAREALAGGAVPVERLLQFRRVRDKIDEGWRAFVAAQVPYAASRLGDARTAAEAIVALPGGTVLYADAALRLGAVLDHAGRAAEAQAVLALAIALDPDRPVTTAEFSPQQVAAVDAARAQAPPRQRVHLACEPVGAALAIDGADVGRAPLDVELARGQHVIVARAPLHRARALAVLVDASTQRAELALDRDDEAAALAEGVHRGLGEQPAQELIDAVARFADVDELVLVAGTDRHGGPSLLVQRCAGSPLRCSAIVELGYGEPSRLAGAARAAWQSASAGELRYPPSVFADPRLGGERPGGGDRCGWCRSPWLWTGVGAAAVIGTIAIVAVVTASKPAPIVTVDPGQFTHPVAH